MTETSAATLSLYFPLWGLNFDSDEAGGIDQGIMIYVPFPDEWRTVQQTDVSQAQWKNEGYSGEGAKPPCCLVLVSSLRDAGTIDVAIEKMGENLLSKARSAVTVLRLYRSGWFLEPELAMYTFFAPSLMSNIRRFPGPYRQVFLSGATHFFTDPFDLMLDDLNRIYDVPGPIAATWDLLMDYRRSGMNTSVEIALESFNRSYGFQLRPQSRIAYLFTALDAMLGSMTQFKIGGLKINNARKYQRRVGAVLANATSPAFREDPHKAARWLHSAHGGRGLRRAIAHGNGSQFEVESQDAYLRLQSIVRCLIRQYLHFATIWSGQNQEAALRLGLANGSPLSAAFVTVLEMEAVEPGSMVDLLVRHTAT